MKRKIVGGIIILALIALPIILYWLLLGNDDSIKDGIYTIENTDEFPDAYIEFEGDVIWIRNMDLNSIYQERYLNIYESLEERGDTTYSEEYVAKASDYNYVFGERGYNLKNISSYKDGTYINVWNCQIGNSFFSLRIVYDSSKKTIQIQDVSGTDVYTFKRK